MGIGQPGHNDKCTERIKQQLCEDDHPKYQRAQEAKKDSSGAKSKGKRKIKKDAESQKGLVGFGCMAARLRPVGDLPDTREGKNVDNDVRYCSYINISVPCGLVSISLHVPYIHVSVPCTVCMRHGHHGGSFSLVSGGFRAWHFGHPFSDGGALVVSAVHTKRPREHFPTVSLR